MQNFSIKEIITSFFAAYPPAHYGKGETIFLPDDQAILPVSLIEEGIVTQYDITPQGNVIVLNTFKAGAFFPVSSAINEAPNRYYFKAQTDVTVRRAPAKDAVSFLKQHPDVVFDLLQRVYRGVDGIFGRIVHMAGSPVKQGIAYELTIMAKRFGTVVGKGVEVLITEEELAQRIGTSRETVSRELQQLKQEGLVQLQRGKITWLGNLD